MKIKIILFFSLSIFLGGCSEYQKVLKSSDINLKYDKALEYFENSFQLLKQQKGYLGKDSEILNNCINVYQYNQ